MFLLLYLLHVCTNIIIFRLQRHTVAKETTPQQQKTKCGELDGNTSPVSQEVPIFTSQNVAYGQVAQHLSISTHENVAYGQVAAFAVSVPSTAPGQLASGHADYIQVISNTHK